MTTIVIANGHILVDSKFYVPLVYEAYAINGMVGFQNITQKDLELIKGRVKASEVTLNGTTYDDDEWADLVLDFNTFLAPGTGSTLSEIKDDVDYPEEIISAVLTPNAMTGVTNQTKGGYVTLYAPEANTGLIYVGTDAVDANCFALEAGKSVPMELADLARIFVKNSVQGEKVHVLGAYKS
jgi:hypothetical protein